MLQSNIFAICVLYVATDWRSIYMCVQSGAAQAATIALPAGLYQQQLAALGAGGTIIQGGSIFSIHDLSRLIVLFLVLHVWYLLFRLVCQVLVVIQDESFIACLAPSWVQSMFGALKMILPEVTSEYIFLKCPHFQFFFNILARHQVQYYAVHILADHICSVWSEILWTTMKFIAFLWLNVNIWHVWCLTFACVTFLWSGRVSRNSSRPTVFSLE